MKILCISPGYWPAFQFGGPIVSVHLLNKVLVKRGIDVTVYATNAGLKGKVPVNQGLNIDGVKVTYFGFTKFFEFIGATGWQFSRVMTSTLKNVLKTFDLIHINAIWNYPSIVTAYLCKRSKKPYIITPRGALYPYTLRKKMWKKWPYYSLIMDRYIKNATAIHYTSEDELEKCHAALGFKNRGIVIPNGIDLSEYENLPSKESFRERYPDLKDKKVILFLGRIHWKKGLDVLLKAYAKLLRERNDVYLLIVGNEEEGYGDKVRKLLRDFGLKYSVSRGSNTQYLTPNIETRVIFTGMLTGSDKLEVLAGSDIFVLPSYSENFGMAVLEAMACGIPVIISDQVGIYKEVFGAKAGLVIRTDAGQLAEALYQLLDNAHICNEMGKNGKRLVREKFSWDKVVDRMISVFGEILNEKQM